MLGVLLAAQLAIVAHAPGTVGACEPLELSVAVSAPGTTLPLLTEPSFAPFDVLRSASTPQIARDSRAVPSTTVEYTYVLVTAAPASTRSRRSRSAWGRRSPAAHPCTSSSRRSPTAARRPSSRGRASTPGNG